METEMVELSGSTSPRKKDPEDLTPEKTIKLSQDDEDQNQEAGDEDQAKEMKRKKTPKSTVNRRKQKSYNDKDNQSSPSSRYYKRHYRVNNKHNNKATKQAQQQGSENEEDSDYDDEDEDNQEGRHRHHHGNRHHQKGGPIPRKLRKVYRRLSNHHLVSSTDDPSDEEGDSKKEEEEGPYVNPFSIHELYHPEIWRAVIAEFLATLFFVGFSILGILSTLEAFTGNAIHAWIIIYHGALILVVIYAFAPLSGAHFNPAVTVTVLCCRRITLLRCMTYLLAQIAGAIVGAAFAKIATPSEFEENLGQPMLNAAASVGEGLFMEFFTTFGLVFGSFATAFDPRGWGKLGPIAIAFIAMINIHAGSFVSGPAMNPARAFGPAVINWNFKDQWIYWVGGILGGFCGGVTYEYLFMFREEARPKGVPSTSGDNHPEVTQEKKEN